MSTALNFMPYGLDLDLHEDDRANFSMLLDQRPSLVTRSQHYQRSQRTPSMPEQQQQQQSSSASTSANSTRATSPTGASSRFAGQRTTSAFFPSALPPSTQGEHNVSQHTNGSISTNPSGAQSNPSINGGSNYPSGASGDATSSQVAGDQEEQTKYYGIIVRGLPPSVSLHEFRLMFALAPDLVHTELVEPTLGKAYFKSAVSAATVAHTIHGRKDIFLDEHGQPAASLSCSYASRDVVDVVGTLGIANLSLNGFTSRLSNAYAEATKYDRRMSYQQPPQPQPQPQPQQPQPQQQPSQPQQPQPQHQQPRRQPFESDEPLSAAAAIGWDSNTNDDTNYFSDPVSGNWNQSAFASMGTSSANSSSGLFSPVSPRPFPLFGEAPKQPMAPQPTRPAAPPSMPPATSSLFNTPSRSNLDLASYTMPSADEIIDNRFVQSPPAYHAPIGTVPGFNESQMLSPKDTSFPQQPMPQPPKQQQAPQQPQPQLQPQPQPQPPQQPQQVQQDKMKQDEPTLPHGPQPVAPAAIATSSSRPKMSQVLAASIKSSSTTTTTSGSRPASVSSASGVSGLKPKSQTNTPPETPVNGGQQIVVNYNATSPKAAYEIMQKGGRVLPPANPADQNPPCNTLYVGNLPPDTKEEELKNIFSKQPGYKRLCFRTKQNGPMCFVEFETIEFATRSLSEMYGYGLSNSVKGGIRLSYSKNPLGVRSSTGGRSESAPSGPSRVPGTTPSTGASRTKW
ncbi:hypothetical protein TRVA0_024S00914 [Trichomonascus vanleenenianus]|uniref:RNA-binding protein n=1 Tax=Trichomonascus vanleenenianus TaxID=2268995 RepID=UPI003ECB6169